MAIGINSRTALAATTWTTIATTPASSKAQVLNVSLCNRGNSTATVRLAVVANGSTTPTNADYIEYLTAMGANTVLERTGIVIQNGQTIVAYCDNANLTAVTYGMEDTVANSNSGAFKFALAAATYTQVSAGPASGRYQTVSLNFCNTTGTVARVRVNISNSATSPATADFIEYDSGLPANATLERTGIVLGNGQQLGVYSTVANVSCVAYIVDDQ